MLPGRRKTLGWPLRDNWRKIPRRGTHLRGGGFPSSVLRQVVLSDGPKLLANLPNQFDEATTKTIENIDVLWLSGQSMVAAFEVEHTTAVYSGLLRMSDLLTMQPNLAINRYLVGPDSRNEKFVREVARPTFASRPKPLHSVCGFLPYSNSLDF